MTESELVTVALAVKAFAACAPELQQSTLGLIEILTDSGTDRDDRYSAALTLHDTLFPGEQAGFAMARRTVPRNGEKPLAFDGEILATAHSRAGKKRPQQELVRGGSLQDPWRQLRRRGSVRDELGSRTRVPVGCCP